MLASARACECVRAYARERLHHRVVQGTRLQAALDRMIRDAEHTRTAHDAERREWAEHERALVDARAAAVAVQAELAQARVVRVLDPHTRAAHTRTGAGRLL